MIKMTKCHYLTIQIVVLIYSIPVLAASSINLDAGSDQTIYSYWINLSGEAEVEKGASVSYTWSSLDGNPGEATFLDPFSNSTIAHFPVAGTYHLELTASDGVAPVTDQLIVNVAPQATCADYEMQWSLNPGGVGIPPLSTEFFPIIQGKNRIMSGYFGWPYYEDDGTPVNGGLPQLGNLETHLADIAGDIAYYEPDPNWDGYGVIDFELWSPIWENTEEIYQTESKNLVSASHPDWSDEQIEAQAKIEYEAAAKNFFIQTLKKAKEVRPKAKWGYYGYPRRVVWGVPGASLPLYGDYQRGLNDAFTELWTESTALYPSVYLFYQASTENLRLRNESYIRENVREAERLAQNSEAEVSVMTYIWYRYHGSASGGIANQIVLPIDIEQEIELPYEEGGEGIMVWGAEDGAGNIEFAEFLETSMGPLAVDFNQQVCNPVNRLITATKEGGGTILPEGILFLLPGTNQTFTIQPITGNVIFDVLVDNVSQGALTTYTFNNIQTDHTIKAMFASSSQINNSSNKTQFLPFKTTFNPRKENQMAINYQLEKESPITLKLYDRRGGEIRTLVNEKMTAGSHICYWDGNNADGSMVASGMYILFLKTDNAEERKKIVVVK